MKNINVKKVLVGIVLFSIGFGAFGVKAYINKKNEEQRISKTMEIYEETVDQFRGFIFEDNNKEMYYVK